MKATKSHHTNIELCVLSDYSTFWEFLSHLLSCSKNSAKNFFSSTQLARQVSRGDTVRLPLNLVNRGMISPDYLGPEINILFENESFLALSKPPKVHIHPLEYDEGNNLLSYLRAKNKTAVLDVNADHYDRGILYRLDFETSGVVICAKNNRLYQTVREDFNTLAKSKCYWAIILGKLEEKTELRHYISSINGGKKMQAREIAKGEGNWAQLAVSPIKYHADKNLTLVSIELKTGLRHQIRVQLAAIGHPILGDQLYGGGESSRLFLHATNYRLQVGEEVIEVSDPTFFQFDQLFQINF